MKHCVFYICMLLGLPSCAPDALYGEVRCQSGACPNFIPDGYVCYEFVFWDYPLETSQAIESFEKDSLSDTRTMLNEFANLMYQQDTTRVVFQPTYTDYVDRSAVMYPMVFLASKTPPLCP